MISGIYTIINTVNNKQYIGSSNNIKKRINKHFNELKSGIHANIHLQNSFNKYGNDLFIWKILKENILKEELEKEEQYFIDILKPEYNKRLIANNNSGIKFSEYARNNMSKAMTGEGNNFYGRKHTDETKEKMRLAKIGKKQSKEQIEKTRILNTGRKRNNLTINKMIESSKNKQPIEIDGIRYESYNSASNILGINRETIRRRIYSKNYSNYQLL